MSSTTSSSSSSTKSNSDSEEESSSTSSKSSNTNDNNKDTKNTAGSSESCESEPSESSSSPFRNITVESIYAYYCQQLLPAMISSLPLLLTRFFNDTRTVAIATTKQAINFVKPKFDHYQDQQQAAQKHLQTIGQNLWQHMAQNTSISEFMLRHFDADNDGHISSSELLNMTEFLHALPKPPQVPETWLVWFSREWPLMDWKLGVFLWRTFGGILLVLAVLTIIPGRLHRWSARVLRWPVLGLTYFLIVVELMVYVVIRAFILIAEQLIARPTHRRLRTRMAQSQSYQEWYDYAAALDKSQRRDVWMQNVHDETSSLYNWAFIKELIKDMRTARANNDSLLALAVIQQCTRKNVGGVMSEDLFCYSNTGEPKAIVKEFIDEVCTTLKWITDSALKQHDEDDDNSRDVRQYDQKFQENVRKEKDHLWKSLVDVTAGFIIGQNNNNNNGNDRDGGTSYDTISAVSSVMSHDDDDHDDDIDDEQQQRWDEGKKKEGGNNNNKDDSNNNKKSQKPTTTTTKQQPRPTFPTLHHRDQVLTFLKRARSSYGRTALCLSGGAMMGLYHFGAVKALLACKSLPHIISGTSAGSIISAILCTRTEQELLNDLDPEVLADKICCFRRPWKDRIKGVMENGNMFSKDEWMQLIKWFTRGDMTFIEAYRRTGKILCITLSTTEKKCPPVLLNYLSAPNVTIASAVVASAAVPGFIPPVRLQVKDEDGVVRFQGGEKDQAYWDGSIQQDIPTQGLTEMLNCQFFIASQCNPHIVPFFYNRKGGVGMPSRWSGGSQEESWRGGFLLAALELYIKNDMKAKHVFLNDLEAAVGFTSTMMIQEYEGSTTIVPSVRFSDFFKLFTDPNLDDLYHYFQAGQVAAYGHISMISLHYKIANTIDDCVARLEGGKRLSEVRRLSFRGRSRSSSQDNDNGDESQPETVDSMVASLLRERTIGREALAIQGTDLEEDEYETF